MRDAVYLATVIVFFAVAVLYVRACAAIAGGDGDVVDVHDGDVHDGDDHVHDHDDAGTSAGLPT